MSVQPSNYPTLTSRKSNADIPFYAIEAGKLDTWLKQQDARASQWVKLQGYEAKPGSVCIVPAADGGIAMALLGVTPTQRLWQYAALADILPGHQHYYPANEKTLKPEEWHEIILGWLLGGYRFTAYKQNNKPQASLRIPAKLNITSATQMADAMVLARQLINRPANDLTPSALAKAAKKVAKACGAEFREIAGEALLKKNYPTIHAVGRACEDEPRLVEIRWNEAQTKLPLVTLVGKGVCFDTGGLNIKTGTGMGLMKKDMGGAAIALALGQLVMQSGLKLRLRVLLPIVENSISGNAFRPQDIIKTRKGITVEIGNTDAEGRLILCDALADADAEKPDLLIDMATLTGASRVALGPDIPSIFTPSEELALQAQQASKETGDPLWRLPLWEGYEEYLASNAADINNAGSSSYAGAITAALFLKRFVTETSRWLHMDVMAWNVSAKPGRPVGGEAQGLRALFRLLQQRYK